MTSPERKLLITIARVVLWYCLSDGRERDRKDIDAIKKLVGMIQREAALERARQGIPPQPARAGQGARS